MRRRLADIVSRLWMRIPARRRRAIVRLSVAAVVVALIAAIPGYVGSQPKYIGHYSNFSAQYRTWSTSVHASVPCQKCHVPPGVQSQAAFTVKMIGEVYISPVFRSRQPKVFTTPTNAACSSCHIDLRTVSPTGDLKIPHRAHVQILDIPCVKCHEYLVHEKSPEGKHTPRMTGCLSCHDGRKAKNRCTTCHTNKAAPDNHRAADWVIVHSQKQKELDCSKCHKWKVDWCADCHTKRPTSHGTRWRSKHGVKVKLHRNCEACHKASFCIRCHGEVPSLNFDPALKLVK